MTFQSGDTVVFLGAVIAEQVAWAGTDYPHLEVGATFTVATSKQFPSFTHVTLEGVEGTFNSVHFRIV